MPLFEVTAFPVHLVKRCITGHLHCHHIHQILLLHSPAYLQMGNYEHDTSFFLRLLQLKRFESIKIVGAADFVAVVHCNHRAAKQNVFPTTSYM